MVLPGESLAKYSGRRALKPSAPEPSAEAVAAVEAALPEEHPLAGFSSVASWVSPEPEEAPAVVEVAAAPVEEPAAVAVAETVVAESDVDEREAIEAEAIAAEVMDAEEIGTEPAETAEGEVAVDEGPEPARIPTSLTAALREQGHRYPHRVSRRMRRKMRGGNPNEEGE